MRIDQRERTHETLPHFWSQIVGVVRNSSSQEFYKRAAEMFELADHSESNFSKCLDPKLQSEGRG